MVWRARFLRDHDVASSAAALDACGASVQKEPALSEGHTCLGMILSDQRQIRSCRQRIRPGRPTRQDQRRGDRGAGPGAGGITPPGRRRANVSRRDRIATWLLQALMFGRQTSIAGSLGMTTRAANWRVRSRSCHAADRSMPNSSLPWRIRAGMTRRSPRRRKPSPLRRREQAFVAKAMTLFRMRRFEEAASAVEHARKIGPTDSTLLTALARSYYWTGTIEARSKAFALYREAAIELETGSGQRSNPMSKVDQCLSLAEVYAKLERPDDARAQLQLAGIDPASKERPTDSHQLFFAALVYAQIGDSEAAIRWLERAIYWGVPRRGTAGLARTGRPAQSTGISCTRNGERQGLEEIDA